MNPIKLKHGEFIETKHFVSGNSICIEELLNNFLLHGLDETDELIDIKYTSHKWNDDQDCFSVLVIWKRGLIE